MGREAMNRRELRALKQTGKRTSRPRTGQPAHFVAWKRDAEIRKHLQKMRVAWLAAQLETKSADERALAKTLIAIGDSTELHNIWDLSRAARSTLLGVPGVGPKTLDKLGEYLLRHQVPLAWSADVQKVAA